MSNELEIKIKDLIPAPELKDSAEYPISQEGVTYKVNHAQIEGKIVNKLGDRFVPMAQKGAANGVAPLDENKKIPNENLSFGEVEEGDSNVVSGGEVFLNTEPLSLDLGRIVIRKNIFNKKNIKKDTFVNVGGVIPSGKAVISNVPGAISTGFIFLEQGNYVISGMNIYENKMYAGLWKNTSDKYGDRFNTNNFVVPEGGAYLRFNVKTNEGTADLDNVQLEKGITATSYAPYSEVNINPDTIISDRLDINNINANKLVFKDVKGNRLNPRDTNYIHSAAINNKGDIISPNVQYDVSGFIPIEVGEELYCRTTGGFSGLYDINLKPLQDSFISHTDNVVKLTGTKDGVYARFSIRKSILNRIDNVGSVIYSPFRELFNREEFLQSTLKDYSAEYINHLDVKKNVIQNHLGRYRLKFDFKLKNNVNVGNNNIEIVKIDNKCVVNIINKAPILQKENAMSTVAEHYQQVIGFQSGFSLNNEKAVFSYPYHKPLVGVDALNIWLNKFEDKEEKQAYLNGNQDISILFENDSLKIVRDGIGANGQPFNGGATSDVISVSTLENGSPKSLLVFYTELKNLFKTNTDLKHFTVDFENLEEDKTTADLLQFGKVKLVTYYSQQVEIPQTNRANQYDSFPCFFPLWKDEKWHTLELVSNGGRVYASIDGVTLTVLNQTELLTPIVFGNSDFFEIKDILINRGSYADAEIIGNNIYSNFNPYVLGLCGHATYDRPNPAPSTHQDLPRLLRVISALKSAGYYMASIRDIWAWKYNGVKLPKRTAFIMLDDWQIDTNWNIPHVRNAVLKNGGKLNFCLIEDRITPENKAQVTQDVTNMYRNGWDTVIHALNHDVRYAWKTSEQIVNEVEQTVRIADETGQFSSCIVYPFGVVLSNMQKLLEYKGISLGIDTRKINSTNSTWGLSIAREALQQPFAIEDVLKYIV